ncbi:hypothetical protein ANCCEY_09976 [Ancylostoma ceylanicum]|uniref:Uncharacterized protein n=1 Tax=Ancylostoma ceylanicum TaxID=53326 RepID=A0A0D6LLP9_9BILA|nr:hypothetical protein ANCCEY_09976 [Ancylostoma ceylanicum]
MCYQSILFRHVITYAVPRSKADNIYHFLLQWSPDKYGQDTTTSTLDESSVASGANDSSRDDRGFIVLDATADETLAERNVENGSPRSH